MKINYAIFDLDGTLLDSMKIWDNIGDDFLKLYGITPPQDLKRILKTMSLKQSAEYFKEIYALPLSISQIMDQINEMAKEKYRCEVTLKPHVIDYLEKLKLQKTIMCVATASDYTSAKGVLGRLGILDYFRFIITESDVGCGKENPKIYNAAAERFGCDPGEIVIFEDALHCVKTAKNAGFYVVGVADKSAEKDKEEIKKLCDQYINSFVEMEDFQ